MGRLISCLARRDLQHDEKGISPLRIEIWTHILSILTN